MTAQQQVALQFSDDERAVSVEMIARDRPRILFAHAYAMQVNDGELVSLSGQISVSLPSLEVAKTLRDALSAFIAFHERMPP